jgi:hypothetical protein
LLCRALKNGFQFRLTASSSVWILLQPKISRLNNLKQLGSIFIDAALITYDDEKEADMARLTGDGAAKIVSALRVALGKSEQPGEEFEVERILGTKRVAVEPILANLDYWLPRVTEFTAQIASPPNNDPSFLTAPPSGNQRVKSFVLQVRRHQ